MKTLNEIEEMMRTYRDDLSSPDRTTRMMAQEVISTLEWVIDYKTLDPIVQEVCDNLQRRSRLGQAKYNATIFANKAAYDEWLNHLQEELMDATLYLERQNECGIKVGDKVKVIRKAESDEDGWENTWLPVMDDAVGNEYDVIGVHGINGITINFDLGLTFPYFVLSKVVEKPEPSPQPTDDDFTGYDEEFMDACMKNAVDAIKAKRGSYTDDIDNWFKEAIELNQAELEAKRLSEQPPKPASGYTATLTFDLTTEDGAEAWHIHKQAYELHSFAFEVLYNLSKNFERELDNEMVQINKGKDSDPVEILRRLINELSENYNLNVN